MCPLERRETCEWLRLIQTAPPRMARCAAHTPSPGIDGQKGLRLPFNGRQSSTVDTGIPFSARHVEYS
eukprot:953303-Prorocentrum_minimum.AAC.1